MAISEMLWLFVKCYGYLRKVKDIYEVLCLFMKFYGYSRNTMTINFVKCNDYYFRNFYGYYEMLRLSKNFYDYL